MMDGDLAAASETRVATCWVCGAAELSLAKPGNLPETVDETAFQITDSDYGRTADIYRCGACGFLQCSDFDNVLDFYREMDDAGYEATRGQRALQSRRLLRTFARHKPRGRLLDVGAGSGILVHEALEMGYQAEGVEPSRSLQARAADMGLPVKLGLLGEAEITTPVDAVSLIDVIEHVPDPVGLMREIGATLDEEGMVMVVTPDVGSLAARMLGWKWWHFRIAHIGYFDKKTLTAAAHAAGFEVVSMTRPSWYFPADYLFARVLSYFPKALQFKPPAFLGSVTVPLNLFDSLCMICRKRPGAGSGTP